MHEYGHFVANELGFGNAFAFKSRLKEHGLYDDWRQLTYTEPDARQGAFMEGWATFFAVAIQKDHPSPRSLWDPLSNDNTIQAHDDRLRACDNQDSYGIDISLEDFSGLGFAVLVSTLRLSIIGPFGIYTK